MAKVSARQKDLKRRRLADQYAARRAALKAELKNRDLTPAERFKLVKKLSEMPRNSAKNRLRNRCEITGRPRGFYRKFRMSRIKLRDLASLGMLPGVRKASW